MRVDKVAPEQVDPEFAAMLGAIPDFTLSAELVGALQAGTSPGTAVSTDTVARDDRAIGEGVVVRVHAPRDAAMPRPAVVSIHGGGYVLGSREMDDPQLERWARELGVVGVSVEYRLAPDTQYPGPLDDCFEAYCWLHEQADDLGVDAGRIGVAGVSAGGGLAAALTLLARERGASMPAFQLLEAPMIDDRQCTPSSRLEGLAIWNRESNEFGWRSYLGDRYGRPDVPAFAAPARAVDLAGLPPTFVSVGSIDGFRDEDVEYATRLNQAGVPTELHVYPGAPHGYQLFADAALAKRAARDVDDWLARQISSEV